MPLQVGSSWNPSLFGGSHAWLGDHLWRALTEGEPLHSTLRAGYPWERGARFIGWLPLIAGLPLRSVLNAVGVFNVSMLLVLPLSALASWPLLRRWSGAGPWTVAAGCVAFALCPFALGTFATGELPKLAVGLIPLFLYALDRALLDERGGWWAAAAAGIATTTAFTSPYFGLALPLLTMAHVGAVAVRQRRVLRPLACGAAVAASMIPAWLYFRGIQVQLTASLYMPAMSPGRQQTLPTPHPAASLQDLLVGLPAQLQAPWDMRHVAYIGTALVVILAALAWRQRDGRPGRKVALALLVGGGLLALGAWLYPREQLWEIPLPALILAKLRYPLASGGMYYRLAVIGSLGLALWLTVECARRPKLAWLLLGLQLGDGIRASGPWPLEHVPVPAAAELQTLEGNGAVLAMPWDGGLVPSQHALLAAALHGRPTTALPRMFLPTEQHALRLLWGHAMTSSDPAGRLQKLGVAWVTLQHEDPGLAAEVEDALGPPTVIDPPLRLWALAPTSLAPRSSDELKAPPRRNTPGPRAPQGQRRGKPGGPPPDPPPRD